MLQNPNRGYILFAQGVGILSNRGILWLGLDALSGEFDYT